MEAQVEKKSMGKQFKTWKKRYWKISDRRLIHYNSNCSSYEECTTKNIKLDIDLALLTFASFYPKSNPKSNLLQIKHPTITNSMLLRFDSDKSKQDTMASWLKVLVAWSVDRKRNRVYVAIPSNFSYSMWIILNCLYDHPDLLKTEGIFRRESTNIRVKHILCSDLLYEKISLNDLKTKYNDINLLAKSLQYLLINLPSSIFGDDNFEDLLEEMKGIDIDPIDDKLKNIDLDKDVASVKENDLLRLKGSIDEMYKGIKHKHRYGLISLILHLIKQITMNQSQNRMTCHAMARLFAMCFESKQYIQNMMDPFRSLLLIKLLIYHSYFLFPRKQYKMKDIVVAEKQEKITIDKYKDIQMSKKQKNNQLKKDLKGRDKPPTRNFDGNMKIRNITKFKLPSIPKYDNDDIEHDDNKESKERVSSNKLNRYKSHDDLDIGGLEKKEQNVTITSINNISTYDNNPNHFEAVHRESKVPIINKRQRSLSVPNLGIIMPSIESPRLTKKKGWEAINQTKIKEFNEACYFSDNNDEKEYIYFICNSTDTRQCWKYDINMNQYKPFISYPETLRLFNYTVSCDQNQQRLFILGGNTEFAELININEQKEYIWNDKTAHIYCDSKYNKDSQSKYNLISFGDDPASIFIGYDIGELHVIGGKLSNYHCRWAEHDQRMIKLTKFGFTGIQGHNILYVKNEWNKALKSKLFLLGGYGKYPSQRSYQYLDQILCCDIIESSNQCKWNQLNTSHSNFTNEKNKDKIIKLPLRLAYFGAVVYKNIFIIILGGRSQNDKKMDDIWYLNLNTMKWKQSEIKCPIKTRGYYAIITNKNVIHLFQRDSVKHFSISACDIIPDKELNTAENQQETQYKLIRARMEKKSTLEIGRQKDFILNDKSSSIRSVSSIDSEVLLSPLNNKNIATPSSNISSSISATPSPTTYDPNIDESKQDIYSPIITPNTPNKKKRKSLPKKKGTVKGSVKGNDYNEHVPIFSDDEGPSHKGYHIHNVSNDSFYNQDGTVRIKKSPKTKRQSSYSKRKKQKTNEYPVNPVHVNYNNNNNNNNNNDDDDTFKYNMNPPQHRNISNNQQRLINHQISRQDIDNDRFSCKVMYDWFANLCSSHSNNDTPQINTDVAPNDNTTNRIDRVPSNSYQQY